MEIIAREKALVRLANKAGTDLTGKDGFVVEHDGGLKVSDGVNALGIVTEGGAKESDVAILGAFGGVLRAKAAGDVAVGSKVVLDATGKVKALPSTSGTYVAVGVALESGSADELVEIAPLQPQTVTVS